ncbi:hypothetical protein FSP39_015892 [Pinctada imbricata]|uniref:Uncharacterized protein n=1 Tax=Pinctada imbricata TaxID=66713 RepID=A0AA88YPJ7_PINIB|nr:hypothetical protein FSP39_015892 [Pinctada imbricata]
MLRLIKETLQDFLGYTSLHGLGRIGAGKHIVQKIIWGLLFLAAACMCFYQVYRLALQYVRKETSTKIVMDYKALDFPDVTICNLNPASYTKVKGIKELYQVLQEAADRSNLSSLVPVV